MAPTTTLEEFTRPKPSTIYHPTTTGQEHATTKKSPSQHLYLQNIQILRLQKLQLP